MGCIPTSEWGHATVFPSPLPQALPGQALRSGHSFTLFCSLPSPMFLFPTERATAPVRSEPLAFMSTHRVPGAAGLRHPPSTPSAVGRRPRAVLHPLPRSHPSRPAPTSRAPFPQRGPLNTASSPLPLPDPFPATPQLPLKPRPLRRGCAKPQDLPPPLAHKLPYEVHPTDSLPFHPAPPHAVSGSSSATPKLVPAPPSTPASTPPHWPPAPSLRCSPPPRASRGSPRPRAHALTWASAAARRRSRAGSGPRPARPPARPPDNPPAAPLRPAAPAAPLRAPASGSRRSGAGRDASAPRGGAPQTPPPLAAPGHLPLPGGGAWGPVRGRPRW